MCFVCVGIHKHNHIHTNIETTKFFKWMRAKVDCVVYTINLCWYSTFTLFLFLYFFTEYLLNVCIMKKGYMTKDKYNDGIMPFIPVRIDYLFINLWKKATNALKIKKIQHISKQTIICGKNFFFSCFRKFVINKN